MKTIPTSLAAHIAGELSTLAYLLKIERRDGTMFAYTTHDRDLTLSGTTYRASDSFSMSSVESQATLAADNLEVIGQLAAAAITDADIDAGRYDDAAVTLSACNWADLSQGSFILRKGNIGGITRDGQSYRFEIRGLVDKLQTTIGETQTRSCRYMLGEARCGVTITATPNRVTGAVTAIPNSLSFTDSARTEVSGFFAYGSVTFTSGANSGITRPVKSFASGLFTLWQAPPFALAAGDAYIAITGCDKAFATCQQKFANATNFGGFPHLPGSDRLLETP